MKCINKFPLLLLVVMVACSKPKHQNQKAGGFASTPQLITLTGDSIREGSGIADSKRNRGFLWVEEDSGNPAQLFLLGHDGQVTKKMGITGAVNVDWEDITLGAGPDASLNYLYVADIGDNNQNISSHIIYRFPEPDAAAPSVDNFDAIRFQYPDGAHDAEAILVDRSTKDIYIITKRDAKSRLYRLAYPEDVNNISQAEFVQELPYSGVVSAAISDDGTEIIVKTYPALYYYKKLPGESIADGLMKSYTALSYQAEAQGEAVCFSADNSGFYTFSEQRNGIIPKLNFYKRN